MEKKEPYYLLELVLILEN